MKWTKEDRPNRVGIKENMCWTCQKAVFGCAWSREFKPIPGWDAEAAYVQNHGSDGTNKIGSYKIYDCPEYVPEHGEEETK